jgi:hypothetical protein
MDEVMKDPSIMNLKIDFWICNEVV